MLKLRKSGWFREGNQPSIVTAVAGMLGWLLATAFCWEKLEKVQADRVVSALLPMLQSLSALAQQYSCAAALCSCLRSLLLCNADAHQMFICLVLLACILC